MRLAPPINTHLQGMTNLLPGTAIRIASPPAKVSADSVKSATQVRIS